MPLKNKVILRLYQTAGFEGDQTHIITDQERRQADQLFYLTLFVSALLGVFGVLLLYLPHHMFPELFPWHEFSHPFVGTVRVKWAFSLYGLVLAAVEISLLISLNIFAVSWLARIYKFPQQSHPEKELHISTLLDLSFERKPKQLLQMGIDPHQGMRRWALTIFVIVIALKASISNIFIKFLIERLLGRVMLVEYIDYVGVPVFALWNMGGTYIVLKSAKLRIITTNIIDAFVQEIALKYRDAEIPKYLFKEVLQFVAYCKRGFDHNHYYYTKKLLEELDIPKERVYCDIKKVIYRLEKLDVNHKKDLSDVIVLGMVIDGHINRREEKALKLLKRANIVNWELSEIKQMAKKISKGDNFTYF